MGSVLRESSFVAFDTETTGKYPLESELCEIAAVKWESGSIVGEFQTLLKPSQPMSDEVIAIHGITNDMVKDAPVLDEKIQEFLGFIGEAHVVAHHAPFDLGFVMPEIESRRLQVPTGKAFCTSLISRKLISGVTNHRLQTLIEHLNIPKGQAHRALDDAKGCLGVFLHCMEKFGEGKSLEDLEKFQNADLTWKRYSIEDLMETKDGATIIRKIRSKEDMEIVYRKGSKPRSVNPLGIVRNPQGDYLIAYCHRDERAKRFYLNKILEAR